VPVEWGGIFAPTLFIGGVTGYVVANLLNGLSISACRQSLCSCRYGGMMGGVMHAPLTAIFLIAEITGGYDLLIPLIITQQ